jgi:hypothetical protein
MNSNSTHLKQMLKKSPARQARQECVAQPTPDSPLSRGEFRLENEKARVKENRKKRELAERNPKT